MRGNGPFLTRRIQPSGISTFVRYHDVLQYFWYSFMHWFMPTGLRWTTRHHCQQEMGVGYISTSHLQSYCSLLLYVPYRRIFHRWGRDVWNQKLKLWNKSSLTWQSRVVGSLLQSRSSRICHRLHVSNYCHWYLHCKDITQTKYCSVSAVTKWNHHLFLFLQSGHFIYTLWAYIYRARKLGSESGMQGYFKELVDISLYCALLMNVSAIVYWVVLLTNVYGDMYFLIFVLIVLTPSGTTTYLCWRVTHLKTKMRLESGDHSSTNQHHTSPHLRQQSARSGDDFYVLEEQARSSKKYREPQMYVMDDTITPPQRARSPRL